MNNIYDLAHQLKRAIMNSPEYKDYVERKNIVYSNEKNRNMVEDFKRQALELQMKQISGKEVDEKDIEKLKNLENILRLNPTINEFLLAEYRFSQLVQDITKIIGEALDIDKDINKIRG